MALKATIYKAELQITDLDRRYFHNHTITVAKHPSETDERMMVRIAAFILNAADNLEFGKGLSTDDEPALWSKSLTNDIQLWIDVGTPDIDRIRKACHQSERVIIYSYGGNAAQKWWDQVFTQLNRFQNLTIVDLPPSNTQALEHAADRTMQLYCTVQDEQLWIATKARTFQIEPKYRLRSD